MIKLEYVWFRNFPTQPLKITGVEGLCSQMLVLNYSDANEYIKT